MFGEKTIVLLMLLTLMVLTTGCKNYDLNPDILEKIYEYDDCNTSSY